MHPVRSACAVLFTLISYCAVITCASRVVQIHTASYGAHSPSFLPTIEKASIERLQSLQTEGRVTSYDLVQTYLERIKEVNGIYHAISETNPDALDLAQALDEERLAGRVRGPLHGVPILVKDNIATRDLMNNTSGSFALLGATVAYEATVVEKLRSAGAVILGKATTGVWAQYRSSRSSSSHGWSPYGGQPLAPYYPNQDPSGSSSGSAIATALGLALGALATETSGSILLPAEKSNIVGIKPTMGLVSRSMVIPISLRQDTVGTHARTVKDAAYLLSAIAGVDERDNWTSVQPFSRIPNYADACDLDAFKTARVGIPRNGFEGLLDSTTNPIMEAFESAARLIGRAGAEVVDHADFAAFDLDAVTRHGKIVLDTDFPAGLEKYLAGLATNPNGIRSFGDLVHFTKETPAEGFPDRDIHVWERILSRNITNESAESYKAYQANLRMAEEDGILGTLDRYNLDALIMPTFAAFHLPAIAGLPVVTVPLGFFPAKTKVVPNAKGTMINIAPGIPFGISFIGRRWSEEKLIGLAYAFEQRTKARRQMTPLKSPSFELQRLSTFLSPTKVDSPAVPSPEEHGPAMSPDGSSPVGIDIKAKPYWSKALPRFSFAFKN